MKLQRDADGNLVYDEDGNLVVAHTNNRWVGTGRTVYDNKGNPVKNTNRFSAVRMSMRMKMTLYNGV